MQGWKNKKIFICSGVIILTVILGACGLLICRNSRYHSIPELERIRELDVGRYNVTFASFDGKEIDYVSHNPRIFDRVDADYELSKARRFLSVKGRKADGWTKDKITYPIYAIRFMPVFTYAHDDVPGEVMVWSNGYLITSSGDVYHCNPDFRPYMKAGEHDRHSKNKTDSLAHEKLFRPLAYAGGVWDKERLLPSTVTEDGIAEGIEAAVVKSFEKDDKTFVKIELRNKRDTVWKFNDSGNSISIEVLLDGKWYYIYSAPNVDPVFVNLLDFKSVLTAGSDVTCEFCLADYGTLPPGDYRIVIAGTDGEGYNHVCAEYKI